jgi:hypothetical protein
MLSPALWAGGCATTPQRHDMLVTQVEGFHHNMRWKRLNHAAAFVTPEQRGAFLDAYRDRMENLQLDEYSVESVDFLPPGEHPAKATQATVRVIRHQVELPDVTRRKIERGQTWVFLEKNWFLHKGY